MKRGAYEKEYIKTLKSMDSKTLANYMLSYISKTLELNEQLASVLAEVELMQKILVETLKKEKK